MPTFSRLQIGLASAAVVATTLGLSACAGSDPNSAAAQPTSLVVAYRNEVTTIDPARADYVQTDTVDQGLYDTLVAFDADGKIVPSLAASAKLVDGAKAVEVTLRENATFHDGTPVTAADVKYSLDRYKSLGVGIAGQIPSYSSAKVDGTHKLTISLKRPDSLFLGALSRIYILNADLVKKNAGSDAGRSWLLSHDAGSGPYRLGSASNGTYTLNRFDKYWGFNGDRPQSLVLRRIDDPTTTQRELAAGDVQVGGLAANQEAAATKAGIKIAKTSNATAYVYFNNTKGMTAKPAVRKAIRLAYDYQGGLDKFRGGAGTIADGPLPKSLACRPELPTAKQDLAEAKAVLKQAGISDLKLTLRFQPAFSEQAQEATLLQSNLASIGVTLKLQPIAYADYLTMLSSFSTVPEMMLATNAAPYPDAGVMLTQEFSSKSVGTNKDAYSNPRVDSLLATAAGQTSQSARCTTYQRVQTIVDQDNAIMPMYSVDGLVGSTGGVAGTDRTAPNGSLAIAALTVSK